MRHKWTKEEEERLERAVSECIERRKELKGPREVFWALVVGRAGLDVSPGAARARWEKLEKERKSSNQDAWSDVAQRVVEYERSIAEQTLDEVSQLREMVVNMRTSIAGLHESVGLLHEVNSLLRGTLGEVKGLVESLQETTKRLEDVWR